MAILPLIGIGAGLAASALGGKKQREFPGWLDVLMKEEFARQDYTGFLPSRMEFENFFQSSLNEIKQELPFQIQDFNANAASRGVFRGGESLTGLYRDVITPAANRAATLAAGQNIQYTQMYQAGRIAAEQQRQQILAMIVQRYLTELGMPQQPSFLSELGGGLTNIGLLGAAGLFSGGGGAGTPSY